MKILLLIFLIFFALHFPVAAQAKSPDVVAKDFYKWYLTELNAERYPIEQSKKRMVGFISARLGRWIYSPAYSEYGADYFIDAQDWERTWVDGISVSQPTVKGTVATVRVRFDPAKGVTSGFGRRTIPVRLVREGGVWKIDMINNRALTK